MEQSKYKLLLAAIFSSVVASGCVSEPSVSNVQSQAEQTQDELMDRMEESSINIDISAVFESDGETIVQIRNTGTKTVSTSNITVSTTSNTFECRPVQDLAPGNFHDCRTLIEFPETGEKMSIELKDQENLLSTYNCTVEREESVAC